MRAGIAAMLLVTALPAGAGPEPLDLAAALLGVIASETEGRMTEAAALAGMQRHGIAASAAEARALLAAIVAGPEAATYRGEVYLRRVLRPMPTLEHAPERMTLPEAEALAEVARITDLQWDAVLVPALVRAGCVLRMDGDMPLVAPLLDQAKRELAFNARPGAAVDAAISARLVARVLALAPEFERSGAAPEMALRGCVP